MVDFDGSRIRVLQKEFFTLISKKKRKRFIFEKTQSVFNFLAIIWNFYFKDN